jgi:acetoin utilization deacetylase AcuC-like enzyme
MSLLLVSSDRFGHHLTPPGHPERPERAQVLDAVATAWRKGGGEVAPPRLATREELTAVHDADYVDDVAATAGRATMLDPDTFTSPESSELARLAAGAVLVGIAHTLAERGPALALVRPPGHHAERKKAMGFCLFNNVAIGAAYARARGVARVAIIDFDVHHGNGTQGTFYRDPSVLYVSTHQFPFYPGTGAASEVGHGDARGRTVNVPLAAGATDADYHHVFTRVIEPVLAEFQPGLILVSAGYDADARDPLAQMRVSTAGFRSMVASLWRSAASLCQGRLVAVTEGGYNLEALGAGLDATVEVLSSPAGAGSAPTPEPVAPGPRGERAVADALDAQKPFWRRL